MSGKKLAVLVGNAPPTQDLSALVDRADFVSRINSCRAVHAQYGSRTDRIYLCNSGGVGRRHAADTALHERIASLGCREVVFSYPRASAGRRLGWALLGKRGSARVYDDALSRALRAAGVAASGMPAHLYRSVRAQIRRHPGFWAFYARHPVWNPSSGCMALVHLLSGLDAAEWQVLLVGFGFQGSDMHFWSAESRLARQWASEGRVVIHGCAAQEAP